MRSGLSLIDRRPEPWGLASTLRWLWRGSATTLTWKAMCAQHANHDLTAVSAADVMVMAPETAGIEHVLRICRFVTVDAIM